MYLSLTAYTKRYICWDTLMKVDMKQADGKCEHYGCFTAVLQTIQMSENTFILTLDGDVDFRPDSVRLLLDRMRKNKKVGAVCGRIHPIGSGQLSSQSTLSGQVSYHHTPPHWVRSVIVTLHPVGSGQLSSHSTPSGQVSYRHTPPRRVRSVIVTIHPIESVQPSPLVYVSG